MLNEFDDSLEKALKILRSGGVILYPTDTIWGLGCDATNEQAVEKIMKIKNRPAEKSFIVLVAAGKDVLKHTSGIDPQVSDFLRESERPVTVIYKHAIGIASNACANDGSVAIRICKDDFCRHLIKRFGKPIVSTSANISGKPSPAIFKEINPVIQQSVDYVVSYRQNDETPAKPSVIISTINNKIEFLRR